MEHTPTPEIPSSRGEPIDPNPDRVNADDNQTDQDIDIAGTEADEPTAGAGSSLDQASSRRFP